MTRRTRAYLLSLLNEKDEIAFDQNEYTRIVRTWDPTEGAAFVRKSYSGALSDLQKREAELLFAVALREFQGEQLSSRIATLRSFDKKASVMAGHEIRIKWYGFDLDDWATLLEGATPVNPLHQAGFLLELARSALKALHLLHGAGFVHADVHNGNFCLPYRDLRAARPSGFEVTCAPDALRLIDLGLSLKSPAERGEPPRMQTATGVPGTVLMLNPHAQPPHPQRLQRAMQAAAAGDLTPWQSLDWRLDLWRLGELFQLWRERANRGDGLTGPHAQRVLLDDLAYDLAQPEREAIAGRPTPVDLPHPSWIQRIDAVLGPHPKSYTVSIQIEGLRLPVSAPSPAVASTLVDTGKTDRSEDAVAVTTPVSPLGLAVDRPYPGGPELLELPRAVADVPGTLLGRTKVDIVNTPSGQIVTLYRDACPPYRVRVPYRLAMGRTTITLEHWDQYCGISPKMRTELGLPARYLHWLSWLLRVELWRVENRAVSGKFPIVDVSWHAVQRYLLWLNEKVGIDPASPYRYRLPTEAEWEYAARAGSDGLFSLGPNNDLRLGPQTANFDSQISYDGSDRGLFRGHPVPAEEFAPNAWGLHQMHGNVREWVQDTFDWHEYKRRAQQAEGWLASLSHEDPQTNERVVRGGSWSSFPWYLSSSFRGSEDCRHGFGTVGFRLARTLP